MQGAFDDTKGSLAVQQCATERSRAELDKATQRTAHYLALGAAGALLTYLQQASAHPSGISPQVLACTVLQTYCIMCLVCISEVCSASNFSTLQLQNSVSLAASSCFQAESAL